MKERIKSMSFWVGLIGSVILILGAFGVEIADQTANAVINGVCSMLVVFGIITPVKSDGNTDPDVDENTDLAESSAQLDKTDDD